MSEGSKVLAPGRIRFAGFAVSVTLRFILLACLLLQVSAESDAFAPDTHYHLTFGMALATCFDWDEAHIIASGDEMTDRNVTTVAETSLKKTNKRAWHAFGHSHEQLNVLWQRVLDEEDHELQMMKFGQFLHFLQDWEAHAGYPLTIGHALPTISGNDPDSLAKNQARTDRMVQASLDHMAMLCGELGRLPDGQTDSDLALFDNTEDTEDDGMIDDLIGSSKPGWRAKGFGEFGEKGQAILASNKRRVEEYVDRILRARGVALPPDFKPGDPDHGLPPPIDLVYDEQGELTGEMAEAVEQAHADKQQELERDPDEVILARAEQTDEGWEILVKVKNNGYEPYPSGLLRLIAADPVAEEKLGELQMPIPNVQPGERHEIHAVIPIEKSAETVLIGLVAEVGPLSGQPYERWFMTQGDLAEIEEALTERGRGPDGSVASKPVEKVDFVGEPKLKTTAIELCVVAYARSYLEDPTKQISPADLQLVRESGERSTLEGEFRRVWSISATRVGEWPVAKTYECINFERELCGLAEWQSESPVLEINLKAGKASASKTMTLEGPLLQTIRGKCVEAVPAPTE
jgi:hypothetical protein